MNTPGETRLPDGWEFTPLGDIVTFEYGKGLRKDKRDPKGNISVYGSNGIVGYHSDSLIEKSCLIIGRKGAAGYVHISKSPCWPIDTTYYIIPPEGVDLLFLYHLLSTLNLNSLDKSTAIPGLNRNDAYALKIPLPPHTEQYRIVARIEQLFTNLDAGVESLKAAHAQLKRYRQSVLKSACEGRLVPTEAELARAEGREYEPAEVLLERILEERRRKWEELNKWKKYKEDVVLDINELPELPEGWIWKNLGVIGKVSGGLTKNSKRSKYPKKMPYIRVANVYSDKLKLDDIKNIGINENEIDRVLLKNGDLLVVEGNGSIDQIGRVALWDGSISPCVHQNHIIKVRFNLVSSQSSSVG